MALLILWLKNEVAPGSSHGRLGTQPADATTGTGWTVSVEAPVQTALLAFGSERPATVFHGAPFDPNGISVGANDCFRSDRLSGIFDPGTWDIEIKFRAVTSARGQEGKMRARIWKGTNPTGAGAAQITVPGGIFSGNQIAPTTSNNVSSRDAEVKATPVTFEGEYFFVQVAWEIDVAGTIGPFPGFPGLQNDVLIRVGNDVTGLFPNFVFTNSRVITPNFTSGVFRTLSDTVSVSDAVSVSVGSNRLVEISDAVSETDTVFAQVAIAIRSVNDVILVTDFVLAERFITGDIGLADPVNVTDTTSIELIASAAEPTESVFVRLTGNDATGDGSFANPYRTVAKGADVAGFNDVLDLGPGDFDEPAVIVFNKNLTLRGKGVNETKIVGSDPVAVITGFTSLVTRANIQNLTLTSSVPGATLIHIPPTTLSVSGALVIARTVFLPPPGSLSIDDTAPDTVDYNVDVLNCVFLGSGQTGKGILSRRRDRVTVVNSIFKDLEFAVDIGGAGTGQRIVSQNNLFYNNFRNLRVGEIHFTDLEVNPQFVDAVGGDYSLLFTSPCRDTGRDLNTDGYGDDNRLPASPSLFVPSQLGLDRGVLEFVGTTVSARMNSTNILTILAAMAAESELFHELIETIRNDRFLVTASAEALRDKWARFFNAFRIHDPVLMTWTLEQWRDFLFQLFKVFNEAPAVQAAYRLGTNIHDVGLGPNERSEPFLFSYYRERRFPIGSDLKLKAKRPPNPTLTVTLSAGRFQIDRFWYRMKERDLLLPDDSTSVIYADGTTEFDALISLSEIDALIFSSTNLLLRGGRKEGSLTGLLTFEQGSNQVVGFGTNFANELASQTDRIKNVNSSVWYEIAMVEDATHLTLERPFEEEDIFRKAANISETIEVFGTVRTEAGDIVEIKRPGLLGGEVLDSGADGQVLSTQNFRTITGNFTVADVGRRIRITGAANSGNDGIRTIVSIVSSIEVELADNGLMVEESSPPDPGTIDWELIRPGSVLVDTPEGRFGTYEIEMPLDLVSAPQAEQREKLIKQLMAVAKAVAKRAYFRYQDQGVATVF